MKIAVRFVAPVLALLLAAPALRAQQPEPVLVVAGPSYNAVMSKLAYIGKLAGQPQLKQQAEGFIALLTQGREIPGLDKDKPCGAVLFASGGLQQPDLIVFLPVADAGAVAQQFNLPLQPDPQREGVLVVPVPLGGQQVLLKSQNGWTWAVSNPRLLEKLPKDPSGWIGALTKKYDLAVQFRMSALPQELRQQIPVLLEAGFQAGLENADEQQQQMARVQLQQIKALVESLDKFTLGLQIDEQNKLLGLDVEVEFSPGSPLGQVVSGVKVGSTRMAAFVPQGAMVRLLVAAAMDKQAQDYTLKQIAPIKQMLLQALEENKEEYPDEESYQAAKGLLEQAFELYRQLVRSGNVDGALALENQDGKIFFNLAMGLPQNHKAGELARALLELLQGEGVPVQFNAASKDGVTYHRIPLGGADALLDSLLGEDASLVLATGPQGCYMALGPKALEQLQQRVGSSRNQQPRQAAHYEEVTLAVRPLLALIQQHAPNPILGLVAGMLPQDQKAEVRLFLDVDGTKQRLRLEVDEALMQVLMRMGMALGVQQPGAAPGNAPF